MVSFDDESCQDFQAFLYNSSIMNWNKDMTIVKSNYFVSLYLSFCIV